MSMLEQKFDEVKINGLLRPSATSTAQTNVDELDNVGITRIKSQLAKRTQSAYIRKPQTLDVQSKYLSSFEYSHTNY